MHIILFVIVIILCAIYRVTCASLGRTCTVLPPISCWFRSCGSFSTAEVMRPIAERGWAASCGPSLFTRIAHKQQFVLFRRPHCLLRVVACNVGGKYGWSVVTPRSEGLRLHAVWHSPGCALCDVGCAIAHAQCTTPCGMTRCALVTLVWRCEWQWRVLVCEEGVKTALPCQKQWQDATSNNIASGVKTSDQHGVAPIC